MEQKDKQQQDEPMEDDDEIDIVGLNKEEEQLNNNMQECIADTLLTKSEENSITQLTNAEIENTSNPNLISSCDTVHVDSIIQQKDETEQSTVDSSSVPTENNVIPSKDCQVKELSLSEDNCDDDSFEESVSHSATVSPSSSKISSRRNSLDDSDSQRNFVNNVEVGNDAIDRLATMLDDDDDDDDDDEKGADPYKRFFFESDFLALKDNKQ